MGGKARIFLLAALCAVILAAFPAAARDFAEGFAEEESGKLYGAPDCAEIDDGLYFIAAGDTVLPLPETTPFWHGEELYVPTSVFAEKTMEWKLNLARIQDSVKGFVILHSGWDTLEFEAGKEYATDMEGNLYTPGLIQRDGDYYVPVFLTARYFDLRCSVLSVDYGELIWLRQKDFPVKQAAFLGAASFQIRAVYEDYRRTLGQAADPPPSPASVPTARAPVPATEAPTPSPTEPPTPSPTKPPEPVREEPPAALRDEPPAAVRAEEPAAAQEPEETQPEKEETIAGGQEIYLCIRGDGGTAALLDLLDRHGVRAAIFCDLEFLEKQDALPRRIAAAGHSIGLVAKAAERWSAAEQLEEGNLLLERALCQKTRLALLEHAADAAYRMAWERGFACLIPQSAAEAPSETPRKAGQTKNLFLNATPSGNALIAGALGNAKQAEELLRTVSRRGGNVSLWLEKSPAEEGLEAFLNAAAAAGDACLPLRENALF